MNHAQVLAARFPNATDRTGWTKPNFELLIREVGHRLTADEMDRVCCDLLRSPRREQFPVPSFGEVTGAVDRFCAARSTPAVDPAVQRLREHREAYTPPSEDEKAWRRACTEALRSGVPAPSFEDWQRGGAA